MLILGYMQSAAPTTKQTVSAFVASAATMGHLAKLSNSHDYETCDVAIIWGGPKPVPVGEEGALRQRIRNEISKRHVGPIVHIETPLIGRQVKTRHWFFLRNYFEKKVTHGEFRVGIGGVTPPQGEFCTFPHIPGRRDLVWRRLGLAPLKDYCKDGRDIVLVGQTPGDVALGNLDLFDWIRETLATIRTHSSRPIVVRPHPRMKFEHTDALKAACSHQPDVRIQDATRETLGATLANAWITVTYSSGAAIDGLLAGVPNIALSDGNFAAPVSDRSLDKVENPTLFDREAWLDNLVHCQWSLEELADGTAWHRFKPRLQQLVAERT